MRHQWCHIIKCHDWRTWFHRLREISMNTKCTAREGKDSNIAHSQAAMYGPAMQRAKGLCAGNDRYKCPIILLGLLQLKWRSCHKSPIRDLNQFWHDLRYRMTFLCLTKWKYQLNCRVPLHYRGNYRNCNAMLYSEGEHPCNCDTSWNNNKPNCTPIATFKRVPVLVYCLHFL